MLGGSSLAHMLQADACIQQCRMEMPVHSEGHHQGLRTGLEARHNRPVAVGVGLRGIVVRPEFIR
jgi:hypothetical protein